MAQKCLTILSDLPPKKVSHFWATREVMAASLGPISDGKMDNSFWLGGADDGKRESMVAFRVEQLRYEQ